VTELEILLVDVRFSISATLLAATARKGSSRADTVLKGIVSPTLIFFRDTSAPLLESARRRCDNLDRLLIEVPAQPQRLQLSVLFAKYIHFSGLCGPAFVPSSGRVRQCWSGHLLSFWRLPRASSSHLLSGLFWMLTCI
jgi:hypothetical protein